LGTGLAVVSAVVLLAAPVGYRFGILPLGVALLTLLRCGAWRNRRSGGVADDLRRGADPAEGSPARRFAGRDQSSRRSRPRRHSRPLPSGSSEASDPRHHHRHAGASGVRRRAAAARDRAQHHGVRRRKNRLAAAQRLPGPSAADPAAGRIEATDTTFWYGFKDMWSSG
jgi:hypothetical protein